MVILGIDPGTTAVGYAILDGGERSCRLLSADLIHISPVVTPRLSRFQRDRNEVAEDYYRVSAATSCERLKELSAGVDSLIKRWSPTALAIERLFFAKNQKTALAVAEARGVILLTAALAELMVYEYTPLEIKKAVTGDGGADKLQLQKMVRLSLPETADLKARDDVFDAIGAALTCYLRDIRVSGRARFN